MSTYVPATCQVDSVGDNRTAFARTGHTSDTPLMQTHWRKTNSDGTRTTMARLVRGNGYADDPQNTLITVEIRNRPNQVIADVKADIDAMGDVLKDINFQADAVNGLIPYEVAAV